MLLKSILFRVAVHRLRHQRQTERNPAFPDQPSVQRAETQNVKKWLGMEGSNLRFLIQSQASYHWTNPQRRGLRRQATTILPSPAPSVKQCGPELRRPGPHPLTPP